MKNTQRHAFTLVELLITITILALIAVVAFTSFGVRQNNAINSKVTSEIETLTNALLLAKQEKSELPLPKGNLNFFAEDTSYVHNYNDTETFAAHGFITHETLPKKYIDVLPIDPRTGSFYAYGKTKGTGSINEMYEIAGVVWKNDSATAYVTGDYSAETGPYNLIRSYNGPNFVGDKSESNFPYNPLERILTAKIDDYSGTVTINANTTYTNDQILNYELKTGDTIEVGAGGTVELYFSDGSRSVLGDSTQNTKLTLQKMDYKQEHNLVTDVKLILESGMIWNKAASLDEESEFEIYTTDSTAAVRGTIFGVQKNINDSQIVLIQGKVAIQKNNISSTTGEPIDILKESISTNNITLIEPSPISGSTVGITITPENESVMIVNENDPVVGVEINPNVAINNTDAIDDIPTDILDDITENSPIFNDNISIGIKEYSYTQTNIDIELIVSEKIFNNSDFILIKGKGASYLDNKIIEVNNLLNPISNLDETINITLIKDTLLQQGISENIILNINPLKEEIVEVSESLNNITNPDSIGENTYPYTGTEGGDSNFSEPTNETELREEINNYDTFIPSLIPTTNASAIPSNITLLEWINSNELTELEISFAKNTLRGNIRVTRSVRLTLIKSKDYNNEDDEEKREEEVKDFEREEEVFVKNRDAGCNGFEFTNISGEIDVCADADDDLNNDNWNLVAYAPYDNAGDLNLYRPNSTSYDIATNFVSDLDTNGMPYKKIGGSNSSNNGDNLSNIGLTGSNTVDYDIDKSYVKMVNLISGIFLTTRGATNSLKDYLQYKNLNLSDNFALELDLYIKGSQKKYLFYDLSNTFKIYINNDDIYIYDGGYQVYTNSINIGEFNKIIFKIVNNRIWIKTSRVNTFIDTGINYHGTIHNLYVGGTGNGTNFVHQLNSIINEFKIYIP